MLVDANVLLYAVNLPDPRSERLGAWLEGALNGPTRIGLPWQSLAGFLRIATSGRALAVPLTPDQACDQVEEWIGAAAAWIPGTTARHGEVLLGLIRRHRLSGPIMTDAQLAALAIEHGVPVCSTDADFARFPEVEWFNPLAPSEPR